MSARSWRQRARGGRLGNAFFALLVRARLLWLAPFFLFWVSLYFLVAAPRARRASFDLARRTGRGDSTLARLRFARRHFHCFGMLLLDRLAVLAGDGARYQFDAVGLDAIRAAVREGRGVVLLAAHFGAWEIMAQQFAAEGAQVVLAMDPLADAAARRSLAALERGRAFRVVDGDGSPAAVAAVAAALREGAVVGLMGDRIGAGAGAAVDFLSGRPRFPLGPYALCAATGAALLHVAAWRTGWRRYSFRAFPAVVPSAPRGPARAAVLAAAAQQFADRLAPLVRAHPEQWGNFYEFFDAAD